VGSVRRGQTQSFTGLMEQLRELDYDSEAVCESPGHYAVRGGIIDIYPVTANQPYRLDFFGDEIEEIRGFDPVTQRSGEPVDSITLSASPRLKLADSSTGIADYLSPADPPDLRRARGLGGGIRRLLQRQRRSARPPAGKCALICGLSDLDEASALFDAADQETTWDTESLAHHRSYPADSLVAQDRLQAEESSRRQFLQLAAGWRKEGYGLLWIAAKEGEQQRMEEVLTESGLFGKAKPRFLRGGLNEGFRLTFRENASCRSLTGRRTPLPAGSSSSPRPRSSAASASAGRS
jgi:transcription-repair coupling factor (superfamily II helicase)